MNNESITEYMDRVMPVKYSSEDMANMSVCLKVIRLKEVVNECLPRLKQVFEEINVFSATQLMNASEEHAKIMDSANTPLKKAIVELDKLRSLLYKEGVKNEREEPR